MGAFSFLKTFSGSAARSEIGQPFCGNFVGVPFEASFVERDSIVMHLVNTTKAEFLTAKEELTVVQRLSIRVRGARSRHIESDCWVLMVLFPYRSGYLLTRSIQELGPNIASVEVKSGPLLETDSMLALESAAPLLLRFDFGGLWLLIMQVAVSTFIALSQKSQYHPK